ncbi:MAG: hypothetical protein HQL54_02730 [Magnetococcales bacterium]|nr:hypothetical protein [Magnetococcales bacterium]
MEPLTNTAGQPEPMSDGFDIAYLESAPIVPLADAAWLAGLTPDAFTGFLKDTNIPLLKNPQGVQCIRIIELIRAGYGLLGQKESRILMLRMQLEKALNREKELVEILGTQVSLKPDLRPTPAKPTPDMAAPSNKEPMPTKGKKGKKGKAGKARKGKKKNK